MYLYMYRKEFIHPSLSSPHIQAYPYPIYVDADVDGADGAAPVGGAALGSSVGDRGRAEDGRGGG